MVKKKVGEVKVIIGFIGFGEVGYEMSIGLLEDGVSKIYAFDPLYESEMVQNRVKKSGVILCSTEEELLQQKVDVVIVAVPANQSYVSWQHISKFLNNSTIYVDVSTASASEKTKVYEEIMKKEKLFVDAAMMGPLTAHKHQVPIYASGNGTDLFKNLMSPYNMNITKVSEQPGDATNIKFIRSIFTKGVSTLLFEVLELAHDLNLEDVILDSISETMDEAPFEEIANRLITGTAIHSGRREKEMENVIAFVKENEKNPIMSQATKDKLNWLTSLGLKEEFNSQKPNDWKLVVKKISEGVIKNEKA
ncbi:DUF1932 domain-containing protein [Paenisporosarcina antarctica]|uniref:NAD(P)-dependent oxidoreductase n=1 Tax=Paenisporosarcina antarctica TaxID=417367 RepID=A0A4P7A3T1_9BACL|nr:DUF1932 domain-containing protein [Paenisporosarcina antarctica]QBP42716.1 NAD(P)-dependent oxidoreductase [Paenisporosarcina antarctica]